MNQQEYILPTGYLLRGPERQYKILKMLGRGGFGITYLASANVKVGNISIDAQFAVKEHFVSSMCSRDGMTKRVEFSQPVAGEVERLRRSFLKEASRIQNLGVDHPNIVKINEVFETNNTAYYVMEYLGDCNLSDFVSDNGRLSVEDMKHYFKPVVEAVASLHDNRIAHYDIKPDNIMMAPDDTGDSRPVLIDFGLSKHYDDRGGATSTTGAAGYSPGFAPVEQYAGVTEYSPTMDVYALAATAYYCLTGKTPPDAFKVRVKDIETELLPLAGRQITDAIVHAMMMLPENRTPDAGSFLAEMGWAPGVPFRQASGDMPEAGRPIPPPPGIPQPRQFPQPQFTQPSVSANPTVFDDGEDEEEPPARNKAGLVWIILGAAIALGLFIWLLVPGGNSKQTGSEQENYAEVVEEYPEEVTETIADQMTEGNKGEDKPTVEKEEAVKPQTTVLQIEEATEGNSRQTESPASARNENVSSAETSSQSKPQTPSPASSQKEEIFTVVEQMPQFPGGEAGLMNYVANHIKYPTLAAENNIQGRVVVKFVVKKDGSVGDAVVVRGKDPDLDKEAVRVVKSLPRFTPGQMNGQPVAVWYTIPINFKLTQ